MSNIIEIESAVAKLPEKELADFRKWFADFDAAVWDRQFEHDVKSGKLDSLATKAITDFRTGKYREL
jgi:hypothetical protein